MKDFHNGGGVIVLIACFSSTDVQLLQKHNEGLALPSLSSYKLPCIFFFGPALGQVFLCFSHDALVAISHISCGEGCDTGPWVDLAQGHDLSCVCCLVAGFKCL